jgi:2'-hydroxyisoflavone reductase
VLAPGDPADLVQFIDVRDLAAFLADACHAGTAGVFNLTGTPGPFGIFMDSSRAVAAGLACRPVIGTIRDTLSWDLARGAPPPVKRAWPPLRKNGCSANSLAD